MTPNPDLACNRAIKFDALLQHALGQGADALATGHYARLAPGAGAIFGARRPGRLHQNPNLPATFGNRATGPVKAAASAISASWLRVAGRSGMLQIADFEEEVTWVGRAQALGDAAGGSARLLAGVDPLKDQSYFLAAVPGVALARCLFPLGSATKEDVRREAFAARLPPAAKRSSAGICFIGASSTSSAFPSLD